MYAVSNFVMWMDRDITLNFAATFRKMVSKDGFRCYVIVGWFSSIDLVFLRNFSRTSPLCFEG